MANVQFNLIITSLVGTIHHAEPNLRHRHHMDDHRKNCPITAAKMAGTVINTVNKFVHKRTGQLSCQAHAFGAEGPGLDSRAGQIGTVLPTASHCCFIFSELLLPKR